MTYFWFLIFFISVPLVLFSFILYYCVKGSKFEDGLTSKSMLITLFLMATLALIYTPIWDNYLVGNNIWFYDSTKVIGITLGYVPIEEYVFFVLQSLLVGVVFFSTLSLLPYGQEDTFSESLHLNLLSSSMLFLLWTISILSFISSNLSQRYLALILIWSLPPIIAQLLFGADIVKQRIKLITSVIIISTLYLSIVDAIAITGGIWTIASKTSTGILIGGILPIEEFVFFLVTNILIVMGLFLFTNHRSKIRFQRNFSRLKLMRQGRLIFNKR